MGSTIHICRSFRVSHWITVRLGAHAGPTTRTHPTYGTWQLVVRWGYFFLLAVRRCSKPPLASRKVPHYNDNNSTKDQVSRPLRPFKLQLTRLNMSYLEKLPVELIQDIISFLPNVSSTMPVVGTDAAWASPFPATARVVATFTGDTETLSAAKRLPKEPVENPLKSLRL